MASSRGPRPAMLESRSSSPSSHPDMMTGMLLPLLPLPQHPLQHAFVNAHFLEMQDRIAQVFDIAAGPADGAADAAGHFRDIQLAGILRVVAVGHISEGHHGPASFQAEFQPT